MLREGIHSATTNFAIRLIDTVFIYAGRKQYCETPYSTSNEAATDVSVDRNARNSLARHNHSRTREHNMPLTIINDHPLDRDTEGNYKVHIATVMLRGKVLITLPGTHISQKQAYIDLLNKERQTRGVRNLNKEECITEWEHSVDLIIENGLVLIRPNPDHMERAFAADELLQNHFSKKLIKFLSLIHI